LPAMRKSPGPNMCAIYFDQRVSDDEGRKALCGGAMRDFLHCRGLQQIPEAIAKSYDDGTEVARKVPALVSDVTVRS
jgi:hypothetical protein